MKILVNSSKEARTIGEAYSLDWCGDLLFLYVNHPCQSLSLFWIFNFSVLSFSEKHSWRWSLIICSCLNLSLGCWKLLQCFMVFYSLFSKFRNGGSTLIATYSNLFSLRSLETKYLVSIGTTTHIVDFSWAHMRRSKYRLPYLTRREVD